MLGCVQAVLALCLLRRLRLVQARRQCHLPLTVCSSDCLNGTQRSAIATASRFRVCLFCVMSTPALPQKHMRRCVHLRQAAATSVHSVLLRRNRERLVAVLAAALGSRTAEMLADNNLGTHGPKASRLAKAFLFRLNHHCKSCSVTWEGLVIR